jgi:hypothetical protein
MNFNPQSWKEGSVFPALTDMPLAFKCKNQANHIGFARRFVTRILSQKNGPLECSADDRASESDQSPTLIATNI